MQARRRITGCWRQSWRRADSPAAPTCWNARRASPARTARTSTQRGRSPTPPGGFHIRNNLFKYHAACYLTHAPIETARKLRAQHGVTPDKVARISLQLDEACDRVCNIPAPRTGLEAKFSLRLTTAMALAGVDTSGLANFSEATAADPVLIALRDKVEFDFHPHTGPTKAALTLELTDGTRLTAQHDSGVPAADVAEQGRRLEAKFSGLVEPILGRGKTGDLLGELSRLDALQDVRGVMALCVP